MIIKNYIIKTNKIKNDITISTLSDIHYSNIFKLKRLDLILQELASKKTNYICIPGDIVDTTNILDIKEKKEILLNFFKQLGSIAPTFITLGNHDYTRKINNKYKEEYNSFWYNDVKKLTKNNIYLLINEIHEEKNIRLIGYIPPYSYYKTKNNKKAIKILTEELNETTKKLDNKKLNILLFHNPIHVNDEEVLTQLNNIDIIISGHMHNGMVPNIIDKLFPKNRGIISPGKTLYPNNARGIKKLNNKITLIISGGITKIQESAPKILHFGDNLYKPQIEHINIIPNNKK